MSCRTTSATSNIKAVSISINPADSTNGIVLYSISIAKNSYWNCSLQIFNIETKDKITLAGSAYEPDLKGDTSKIVYKAIVVPAGEYRLFNWSISDGTANYLPKANFSIPMTVHGGEINYIGDYAGVVNSVKLFSGTPKQDGRLGPYFIVSNRYNVDVELIERKFPHLPPIEH